MNSTQAEIIDAAAAGIIFMDGVKSIDTKTQPEGAGTDLRVRIAFKDGRKVRLGVRWVEEEEEAEQFDRDFPETPETTGKPETR
jgi:hypothetical protein